MTDLDRKVANAMGLKSVNDCEYWGLEMTEEDEAFNEIERQAKQRKESVKANFLKPKSAQEFYDELRNNVIDEVSQEIEKLTGFGKDTIDGLAIYIRKMKK